MRILVFGNSGSGKSTYAKSLACRNSSPHLDLDTIIWEPGQIAVARSAADVNRLLLAFIGRYSDWIIEGCYGEVIGAAALHCDELVFLNPGLKNCLANNIRRPWEPHKYASIAEQNRMLENLQAWVTGYYEREDGCSYSRHREIFDSHLGQKYEYLVPPDLPELP